MGLRIFTDASYKDGVATHHFRVVNSRDKVIKRRTIKGMDGVDNNNNDAELTSVVYAMQWIENKGHTNVVIYTDSQETCKKLNKESELDSIKYIQWLMKGSKVKVKWRGNQHHFIKQADKHCKELLKTVLNRVEYNPLIN